MAQRLSRRLAPLALLAAVPGPHDGARIAFARGGDQDDGLPFHIHTVSLASGRTSQVTGGKVQDLMPSWQPR
ncbi:MAG TPA: hypothetical protein VLA80_06320 [Actinomycetota bacterium]|nr:hypothetical protein [Actinomycetota bacterium]